MIGSYCAPGTLALSALLLPTTAWGGEGGECVRTGFFKPYLETGFDGLHRAGGMALHALEEEQTSLLVQDRVRRPGGKKICVCKLQYLSPARVAGDVLLNVPPQYVLYVLLLKTTCSIILS